MYSLDKMLVLEDHDVVIRVSVDCPEKYCRDFYEALQRTAAYRVEQHFYDQERRHVGTRSQHHFLNGFSEGVTMGKSLFVHTPSTIEGEIHDSHSDYHVVKKAAFVSFVFHAYQSSIVGFPQKGPLTTQDERISKLEYFVYNMWHAPGMPGMIQAQHDFMELASREVPSI
jgi:hypothetical protein